MTSLIAHQTYMPFSKSAMQEQLTTFLSLFGKDVAALYGLRDCGWAEKEVIEHSPVCEAVSEMYDYGIDGIPTADLGPGGKINGIHAHVEAFFHGLDTPNMKAYLEASQNALPRLAMLAVQSAVARMVLDGGDRYSNFGEVEHGVLDNGYGYLTLAEIALLANMDERSVRNAANPKLPDPLKPEQVGRRSLVTPEEARRWLAGRKGFVPTKKPAGYIANRPPEFDCELAPEIIEAIERDAKKAGLSFSAYLEQMLLRTYREMEK